MRALFRLACCLFAVSCTLLGAQSAGAAVAQPEAAARTLHYDASGAPSYQDSIAAAVRNWNGDVQHVQLAAAQPGGQADFTIAEDDGWPRTNTGSQLGTGQIVIGEQAVDEGYDKVRIAAHEIGHILGLPDDRDGRCATLMSGHSAPVSCTSAHPDAAERAEVESNFADQVRAPRRQAVFAECYSSSSMR